MCKVLNPDLPSGPDLKLDPRVACSRTLSLEIVLTGCTRILKWHPSLPDSWTYPGWEPISMPDSWAYPGWEPISMPDSWAYPGWEQNGPLLCKLPGRAEERVVTIPGEVVRADFIFLPAGF